MKKLMLATLALAAAFTLTADNYTPSSIPSGLTEPDVTPGEINYQGLLRNPKDGNLYADGIYTLECRIYSQQTGGTPLWGASYTAYVKDGYFNLMLGAAGASLSGCTYGPTSLWKALWYTPGRRDLYLGVTPLQGADGAALVSPQEIKPRQKLLTAPFAFRAQKAQYADAAPGNFNVGGNLEVAGNVTVANGKKLTLKNISASDSDVKIGNSSTSPATTTLQGSKVTIESGSALNVNSHGNANVTMDTGKTLNVNGGSLYLQNAVSRIKSTDLILIDGGAQTTIAGDEVRGKGPLTWNIKGRGDVNNANFKSPIVLRWVNFTMKEDDITRTVDLKSAFNMTTDEFNKYAWRVVGIQGVNPTISAHVVGNYLSYTVLPWRKLFDNSYTAKDAAVSVCVMGVILDWCDATYVNID